MNVFLIEAEDGWTLVDSGLHTDEAEAALRAALAELRLDLDDIARVFVTHLHPDHIGMAGTLERAGADIVMHAPEAIAARQMWSTDHVLVDQSHAWFAHHGMPSEVNDGMRDAWLALADRVDPVERIATVSDGDSLDLGGRRMRVIWTPGHTDHHAVLVDETHGILFAGDHVLPKITSNIGLYPFSRDDPLGDFLWALGRVRDLGVTRVLPAHGDPFDDLSGRVDALLEHHRKRLDDTLGVLDEAGGIDAYAVCRRLFPVLRSAHEERFALAETLAHLRHLERSERALEIEGAPARWRRV